MKTQPAEKIVTSLYESSNRSKISRHLLYLISRQNFCEQRPLIILCIGSERYTGDALGPLVGSYLLENSAGIIIGTLDEPVHAGNLADTIKKIERQYANPIIIAVDACLGNKDEIGNIEVWQGGLEAGIAVGHKLPCVGQISIIGVVNSGGQFGYFELQNTPLSIVIKLMKVIGEAISDALKVLPKTTNAVIY